MERVWQNLQGRKAISTPSIIFYIFLSNANCLLIVIQLLTVLQSLKLMTLLCTETKGRYLSLCEWFDKQIIFKKGKKKRKSKHFAVASSPLPNCEWAIPFFMSLGCLTIF